MFIIPKQNKHIVIIFIKWLLLERIKNLEDWFDFAVGRAQHFTGNLATE